MAYPMEFGSFMKTISVIGVGLCYEDLTPGHLERIENSDVLFGGKRHLSWFPSYGGIRREIVSPLSEVISDIRRWSGRKKVAVLASGDPLFYGIGQTLIQKLGPENVDIFPNVSTLAACFARIKTAWRNAEVVSLHGNERIRELVRALFEERPIFVLTDPEKNPAFVGRIVSEIGDAGWRLWVFEKLGSADERVRSMSPMEAAAGNFREPNAVVLKRKKRKALLHPLVLGAPDDWYEHERGLITKPEVRAITLSKLRLDMDHVLWDLGAGSGSISIEAALFVRRGQIIAVEKKASRVEQIHANIKKFRVGFIEVIQARLPEGLEELPSPDRVFIGGGGKDLPKIIKAAADRLLPSGRMVINTVLFETLAAATAQLNKLGFETETVQAQINESARMESGTRLAGKNPVWILSAKRSETR